MASRLDMADGSLQLLAFVDYARGWNVNLAGETGSEITARGTGIGARYDRRGGASVRFDVGRAGNAVGTTRSGDWRGHLSLVVNL
jgi:hemolysin activation/secretion protein